MYTKCLTHGLNVTRESVRLIVKDLDPDGVSRRQRRRLLRRSYFSCGPNYIWHIDCYDKLKPFGICKSGCIDGFSRKIIWLNADKTNNNPKIIGGNYLSAVIRLKGFPRVVRADFGTENVVVRDMQVFFRRDALDSRAGSRSYIDGSSTANERIESWWGILRKQNADYWIQLFTTLKDEGEFDGSFLDKSLIQFCFMGVIQVGIYNVFLTKSILIIVLQL